jgi:glutamate carboxypeptidase
MILEHALTILRRHERATLPLIETLVRINSHTAHVAGVNRVGEEIRKALAPLPLNLTVVRGEGTGDHLVFRTKAASEQTSVLLIAHHDTVFPPGTFERFSVDGDIARGPGVLDMKGGIAVLCTVLAALHEADLLARMPITFVTVADEEIGSPSSHALLEELAYRGRSALVFEAGRTGDAIITARRGSGYVIVRAHGRAAHAGNALAQGRNAIWALSRFIDRAQLLTDTARGISFSAGLIRGGTARNTVADSATCEADVRFSDPAGERVLSTGLAEIAHDISTQMEGTSLEVNFQVTRKPWTRSPASVQLMERYATCQRASGLEAGEAPLTGGGSDANTVGAVGLAAIDGLGPRGSGFHTPEECIEVSSLSMKAEALLRFLIAELAPTV